MRFIQRLTHVVNNFKQEEAIYLYREILHAIVAGYILSDIEVRMWNQLGHRIGGK